MTASETPSIATIAIITPPDRTVYDYLCRRFPRIAPSAWRKRIETGRVLYRHGAAVRIDDIARVGTRILYYREIEDEPPIPFSETILYWDDHILVADKPHFLPVIPAGKYVNETLLARLKKSTGIRDMVTVNRLDRLTAGLVLFSINRESRDAYYELFRKRQVRKTYRAVAREKPAIRERRWRMENRVVQGDPWFRMRCEGGPVNAITDIALEENRDGFVSFILHPETGRKHQLRLHMALAGYPILNDRCYPLLLPEEPDDYSRPLQLLAESISFRDPLTGSMREFLSKKSLTIP